MKVSARSLCDINSDCLNKVLTGFNELKDIVLALSASHESMKSKLGSILFNDFCDASEKCLVHLSSVYCNYYV
jgi:hypothetical protein